MNSVILVFVLHSRPVAGAAGLLTVLAGAALVLLQKRRTEHS